MKDRTTQKKRAMLEALEKSLGVVTTAAKNVGIHRKTHYQWMKDDSEYQASVQDLGDVALDFAESQLHKQILEGNTTAAIFYLKCKGKHRGYVEKSEYVVSVPTPVETWLKMFNE